jgi:hypothetical protein
VLRHAQLFRDVSIDWVKPHFCACGDPNEPAAKHRRRTVAQENLDTERFFYRILGLPE